MPEFPPGEQKTAIAPMTNPTAKPFDYKAELYMGTDLALMAQTPFHLEAGESKDISLPVTMPSAAGTYPVHIAVFSDGQFIEPLYQAEDVVITPGVVIDLPNLTILDVEGIPFSEIVTEVEDPTAMWTAFGQCLQQSYGSQYIDGVFVEGYIASGVGLALCMMEKGAVIERYKTGGAELKQCGIEHPEYLTDLAKSIPPPFTGYMTPHDFYEAYGITEGCVETDTYKVCVEGMVYDNIMYTYTYKVPYWYGFPHQAACDVCIPTSPFPPPPTPITYYVLSQPIEMSVMRGVTLTCKLNLPYSYITNGIAYLWYEPQFVAGIPPAFRGYYSYPGPDIVVNIPILSCFGGGYYYEGIYDGEFQIRVVLGFEEYILATFKIKNLVKVTGTGTVTP